MFGIVNISVGGGTLGWCSKSAGKTLHHNYILSFAKAFHGEQMKKRAEALTFLMRLLLPPAEVFALHPSKLCVIKYIESTRHTYPPTRNYIYAYKLLSRGIPCNSRCSLTTARGVLIMKHFFLQMSKKYLVTKAGQAKIWTLEIWTVF